MSGAFVSDSGKQSQSGSGQSAVPSFVAVGQGVVVLRDVMVPMRDGVKLATDIYLPASGGVPVRDPLPAILERTPYGKSHTSRSEITLGAAEPMTRPEVAGYFARAGYAVIYQDCRGRHGSEGDFTKYLSEGPDGYDTMAWIVAQPWSDGRIGTMGLSYAAHTQMAAACLNPPGLACMILDSGGFSNAWRCGIRQGGAFELKQATWAWNHARDSRRAEADPQIGASLAAEDLHAWFRAMPWSKGRSPVRWEPDYEAYLLEQWRNGSFDAFWKRSGIYAAGHYETFPEIPVALMSSWYDAYVHTTFDNYAGLKDPERPLALIMGPWTHGNRNRTTFGDVDFGAEATFDGNVAETWLAWRRAWFDRWLRREGNVDAGPALKLFVMGGGSGRRTSEGTLDHGGRWIDAESWPLPGTVFRSLYLRVDGGLGEDLPTEEKSSLSYDFDPSNPIPTIGGALTSGEPIFTGGAFDQREDGRFFGCRNPGLPLSARHDVLSFETEPLAEDLTVIGPIEVELWVTSDAPDTDFTAKLIDVHPPSEDYPTGFAMNITDGIIRCRYRKSDEQPEPIAPGEVFRIAIEPFATANLFRAGHRLRLDISSSNFPRFDVNPNTGAPEGDGRTRRIARNTVFMEPGRASHVRLPIVKNG